MRANDETDDAAVLDLLRLADRGAMPARHHAYGLGQARYDAARDRLIARGHAVLIDGIGCITEAGTAQALADREAASRLRDPA